MANIQRPKVDNIVRYDCGCVGLPLTPDHTATLLLFDCTGDDYVFDGSICIADRSDKKCDTCDPDIAHDLLDNQIRLAGAGAKFRVMQKMLNPNI